MDTSKMSPDELLAFMDMLDKIKRISEPELPPRVNPESLVRQLEGQGEKRRLTQARAGVRKKQHWKEKKRKQRERMRPYMAMKYRSEKLPLRTKLAQEGDWWSYYVMEWKKRGYKIDISLEEWDEAVAPCLKVDSTPVLYRLNTAKPIALYNILIKNGEDKSVLFDGQEWLLNKLGATIPRG